MLLIDEQLPELPTILKNSIVTAEDSALAAAAAPSLRGALGEALQALGGAEVPSEKLERMVLHADTSAAQVAACKVLTSQCSGRAARAATWLLAGSLEGLCTWTEGYITKPARSSKLDILQECRFGHAALSTAGASDTCLPEHRMLDTHWVSESITIQQR